MIALGLVYSRVAFGRSDDLGPLYVLLRKSYSGWVCMAV
ncbi:hypothetical protein TRVA0_025S00232 [Trichomonascus vanleenenianus]